MADKMPPRKRAKYMYSKPGSEFSRSARRKFSRPGIRSGRRKVRRTPYHCSQQTSQQASAATPTVTADSIKTKVKNDYKKVEKKWEVALDTTLVKYFCHCTSSEAMESIVRDDMLKGNADKHKKKPITENPNLKGVFFMVSLYHGDNGRPDRLPTISPYGEHRIKIPVQEIIDDLDQCHLYFESAYFKGKRYIRVVLVKDHQKSAKQWCDDNLLPLKKSDNNILRISYDGSLKVQCALSRSTGEKRKKNLYVEVFVVGDVTALKQKGADYDSVQFIR